MRILFLATKMCQPQCRDEERCAENHSSDHNSALETIQMPSFWEHTRLDVLHVPGVATRVSTRSIAITCAPTSLAAPTAAAALPRSSLLPYIPQSKEQDRTTPTAHQKKEAYRNAGRD